MLRVAHSVIYQHKGVLSASDIYIYLAAECVEQDTLAGGEVYKLKVEIVKLLGKAYAQRRAIIPHTLDNPWAW